MAQELTELGLTFAFPDDWVILRPQDTAFYRNQFQQMCGGCKETDFAAYDPNLRTLWLVEVKDFRVAGRQKPGALHDEVALKVRDTLAFIMAGGLSTLSQDDSKRFWISVKRAKRVRVVLHCELPAHRSKLFPGISSLVNVAEKLRRSVRAIDSKAVVTDDNSVPGLPWIVTQTPQPHVN